MITLEVHQDILPEDHRLPTEVFDRISTHVNDELTAEGMVAVTFLTEEEMQRFNRMYRGKDKVTDVLSFSYIQGAEQPDDGGLLGDVALSYEQATRQAVGRVEDELIMLTVHGILHVFGYDHEEPEDAKKMFPLQDSIVDRVIATV